MASRTSLTDTRIADGYGALLHVSDDGGLDSSEVQIYDGDGTASVLSMGTASASIPLPRWYKFISHK